MKKRLLPLMLALALCLGLAVPALAAEEVHRGGGGLGPSPALPYASVFRVFIVYQDSPDCKYDFACRKNEIRRITSGE